MKKSIVLASLAFLALPLAMAPVASASTKTVATTASKKVKSKSKTYQLASGSFPKTTKTFHTKNTKPFVYSALIYADQAKVTLTKIGNLKAKTNYKVTKAIKVKISSKKYQTYVYAKGHGWVAKTSLVAGKY